MYFTTRKGDGFIISTIELKDSTGGEVHLITLCSVFPVLLIRWNWEQSEKQMYKDTKTRWDRIGDYLIQNWLKKGGLTLIVIMMLFSFLSIIATVFINKASAEIGYKTQIANIRYLNIK